MDSLQTSSYKKPSVPYIVWWSAAPSCLIAFLWVNDFIANKVSNAGPLDRLASIIGYPFAFALFFIIVWTPLLGITLTVCMFVQGAKPYYSRKLWIVLAVLLLPFYICFHILLTAPSMAAYRKFFHLHQLVTARLSENQVIAIANKVAAENTNNLDIYLPPTVVFYSQAADSLDPSFWEIIYNPKSPVIHGQPETYYSLDVRIIDKTGNAGYWKNIRF